MDRVLAGRYELEVPLGRGGSGELWRGTDLATQRPVAVKLIELSLIDDPGLVAETIGRLRREATVLSGLRHPNIVGALDAGRIGNQLFVATELATGMSLAGLMDERGARGMGLFSVATVLRIAEQVCAGLGAAHQAGVVHRDIKPSNLMVTPQFGVKIIDFGIDRLLADNAARLTASAHPAGAIAYMSPERAQGRDVDGRGDLYSLGCVLYQLLSGRPPFFSALPGAMLMMQVLDTATPLSAVRPGLPDGLSELVGELMEKDPAARPADAAQVVSRLAAIEEALGSALPEYEAELEMVMASGHRDLAGGTRLDLAVPGPGRSAVLTPGRGMTATPDRMTALSGPDTVTVRRWDTTGPDIRPPAPVPPLYAAPVPPPYPAPVPAAFAVPAQSGPPIRSAPQAVTGSPGGPTAPAPRPGPAWRGVVGTLVAAALVAGAGAYFWEREHQTLRITSVNLRAANQAVGCNGTADVIGTIGTNGRTGRITYEWVRGGVAGSPASVNDASGSKTVQVDLKWPFHGKGKGRSVTELRVLTPQQAKASITFPYSCPK